MIKPISISLSPNTESIDTKLAFKLWFQPWRWNRGTAVKDLEKQFKEYLGVEYAFAFNSGRSALMATLNALGLKEGSEVLLQAFTCNAASNPILWSGFKPVFVDCLEDTFNMDPEDLRNKITPNSKVVMVQHTFGLAADMDKIKAIAQEHNLILLEDGAHSLGATYKNKKVGTFGKAAFFSFSRDKIISAVYGGMVVTEDEVLAKRIAVYQTKIGKPSCFWTLQQLLHPVFMNWLILPTYRILGKYLLVLFQKAKVLSKAVHKKEKQGLLPNYFPKQLPNALAILALKQFTRLERFNSHRKEIANFYFEELANTNYQLLKEEDREENVFLRFTVKNDQAHDIIKQAWANNLLIGDWYTSVIVPPDTNLSEIGYLPGTCPKAEKLAKITLNLPTHINISKKEAQIVVNFLKHVYKRNNR